MTTTTITIALVALIVIGIIACVLTYVMTDNARRAEILALRTRNEALSSRLAAERADCEADMQRTEQQYAQRMAQQNEQHVAQMTALREQQQEQLAALREQQSAQLTALREQQSVQLTAFRAQLENATRMILEQRQEELQRGNTQQMERIVRPLRENLDRMHEALQKTKEDTADRSARLEEQMKQMADRAMNLGEATQALTSAMMSNGKVQGDWGEHVLETILENSGLVKGINYETQVNAKNDAGQNMRPDVVVHCPGGMRDIIIDSKVSLTAYTNYVSAQDKEHADAYEKENYASLRKHVEELAAKDYSKLDKRNLPQVLMFVPNEGSYILGIRHDAQLGQWAFNKGVVILTPTNLMLTLELVCALWVNEHQEKNVEKILATANTLYEKFCAFSECMAGIQNSLKKATDAYDYAVKYLNEGQANVVRQVDNLRKLGIKYNKAKEIDAAVKSGEE